MLALALSALVLAATPAELCAKCDEVRGLVDKYPVLAPEIRATCGAVLDEAPGAACVANARAAVAAAERVIAAERCADCEAATARVEREAADPALAMAARTACRRVAEDGPCADAAVHAEARVAGVLQRAAMQRATEARYYATQGEVFLALEKLLLARKIEPMVGIDFERRAYEADARALLESMSRTAVDAMRRGREKQAMDLVEEIGRISSPLGLGDIHLATLLQILDLRPGGRHGEPGEN